MRQKYPVNVWCGDGVWSAEAYAACGTEAIREVLRVCRECDRESDDLDPGLWTAHLGDIDLLDARPVIQRLSEERLREIYCGEMDELGAELVRGDGRWHMFVTYWRVELKEV